MHSSSSPSAATTLDAVIAGNVRAIRARRRLPQDDLDADLGWARPAVSTVEAGATRITIADAIELCSVLKVSLGELLDGAEPEDLEALGL